jgi:hypothetical protein
MYMYNAANGTRTAIKTGVVTHMTPSVKEALATFENNSLKDLPIASSTRNISVENRLSMRPTGVVFATVNFLLA